MCIAVWGVPVFDLMAKTSLFRDTAKTSPKDQTLKNPEWQSVHRSQNWSNVVLGNPIVVPSLQVALEIESLLPGDSKIARIQQSILALGESKSPVAARLTDDRGRDITLLGEATLEKNSKRILIDFKTARLGTSSEVFEVKAQALDLDGALGVEGEYYSGESKFFAAELAAAAAAGFADASVNRPLNAFGNQQEEHSLDTNAKKAVGSALSRTADRFAEKIRQAPEYSVLKGPATIKVLILEQPKRKL